MTGATYARGSLAWGLCQRCGLRFLLNDLRFDGFMPGLRVCEECWDDRHPQEFPISVSDPQALWKPAPDGVRFIAPALSFFLTGGTNVHLNWSSADFGAYQSASYSLYKDSGAGFVLRVALPNGPDFLGTKSIETKSFLDVVALSSVFSYRVDGIDVLGDIVSSNVVVVTT